MDLRKISHEGDYGGTVDLRKLSHEGDYGGTVDLRKLSHGRMTVEGRSCNFCGGYGVVSVAGMG